MDSQFNHKITRFPTLFFLTALISLLSTLNLTAQRRLLVLSWNVESGGNDKHTIVKMQLQQEKAPKIAMIRISNLSVVQPAERIE